MTEHENLHAALAAVQAALPDVGKGQTADTGKYTYDYATLHDVSKALLPLLSEHGLTWVCIPNVPERVMRGILTHASSGEVVGAEWVLPNTSDPQAIGSAITYGRRYLLTAIVGLAPADDDDDGAAARQAPAPQLSERDQVANLIVEYVQPDHVPHLLDAYQEGATTLDEVDDTNVQRMYRALGSKGTRTRVLQGVAERANGGPSEDEGDGGGEPAPAPEPDDDGGADGAQPSAPDASDRTDEGGAPSEDEGEPAPAPDPDPQDGDDIETVAVDADVYADLNAVKVALLVKDGEVVAEGRRITTRGPHEVWTLEQDRSGPFRKTVKAALDQVGYRNEDTKDVSDDDGDDSGDDSAEAPAPAQADPAPAADDTAQSRDEQRKEAAREYMRLYRLIYEVDQTAAGAVHAKRVELLGDDSREAWLTADAAAVSELLDHAGTVHADVGDLP